MADDVYVVREDDPKSVIYVRAVNDGRAQAQYLFAEHEGRPRLISLSVVSADTQRFGLDVTAIRDAVASADLLDAARECLKAADDRTRRVGAFLFRDPRAGRPVTLTDIDHALIAWAYIAAVQGGDKRPFKTLEAQLGTDATLLKARRTEAIRHKFLQAPGTSGRPGGSLTAKALTVLRMEGFDPESGDPIAAFKQTRTANPDEDNDGADDRAWRETLAPDQAAVIKKLEKLVATVVPNHKFEAHGSRISPTHPLGPNRVLEVELGQPDAAVKLLVRIPREAAPSKPRWLRYDAEAGGYRAVLTAERLTRQRADLLGLLRAAFHYRINLEFPVVSRPRRVRGSDGEGPH